MKFIQVLSRVVGLTVLLNAPTVQAQLPYALNFDGANDFVSVPLASPPASDYTICAWVYLRAGGTYSGTRMAVLSSTSCGGSIELLIRANTENPADPQYLELGRCNSFNGTNSTQPVALNAWTHVAVTVSATKTVSYYINGNPAGNWTNASLNFSLGAFVNLGDNSARKFNGLLDEVQLWSRVLNQSEIQTNLSHSLAGNEAGLYAYYGCNEGSGLTAASVPPGHDATLNNGTTWVASTAPVGPPALPLPPAALSFDGFDDYVSVPHTNALNSFPLTVAFWMKTMGGGDAALVDKFGSNGNNSTNGWKVFLRNNSVRASYISASGGSLGELDGGAVSDGHWHHIAFVADFGQGRIYVDGVLNDSRGWNGSQGVCTSTQNLRFAATAEMFFNHFNGQLDEVTIWSTDRSATEIQADRYQPPIGNEPSLVAYYPFYEGSGLTTASRPHGLTGSLSNGPSWLVAGPPSAATLAATQEGDGRDATLQASVNPNGIETSAYFEYGFSTSYGNKVGNSNLSSGTDSIPVTWPLNNLSPHQTYHYRVVSYNNRGTNFGADVTFTTFEPPTANTSGAGNIGTNSASLNATVNPNGATTTAYFEYGLDDTYGNLTVATNLGSAVGSQFIAVLATNLQPGQFYHFRVVAGNRAGTNFGFDQTFTTVAIPATATTLAATSITAASAVLSATVNPNGVTTTAHFDYGLTTNYSFTSGNFNLPEVTNSIAISNLLSGLLPSTLYHFRVATFNAGGSGYGLDRTFLTSQQLLTVSTTNDSGAGSLRQALLDAKTNALIAISATGTLTLASSLPFITSTLTINGPGETDFIISGATSNRVFFVDASNCVVNLNRVTIANGRAKGGDGGLGRQGGGGGLGAGGGLFINAGQVVLSNVNFVANAAIGGAGGEGRTGTNAAQIYGAGGGGGLGGDGGGGHAASGGGGGGFGGRGGSVPEFYTGSGGGGGVAGDGGTGGTLAGGGGGAFASGQSGSSSVGGVGADGRGGNGGNSTSGQGDSHGKNGLTYGGGGGGGYGRGFTGDGANGGNGGRFGGGGGANYSGNGGTGGEFGGGGGASPNGGTPGTGGSGGFGGGGGGGNSSGAGNGGFGAGGGGKICSSTSGADGGPFGGYGAYGSSCVSGQAGGGGGGALGAAVFVRPENGAALIVTDCSVDAGLLTPGLPGTGGGGSSGRLAAGGQASGSAFFFPGGSNVFFVSSGERTITGTLGDWSSAPAALVKEGAGTLVLGGSNSYAGNTLVNAGTLRADGSVASSSNVIVSSGATLAGTGTVSRLILNIGSTLSPGASPGTLTASNTVWIGAGNYNWQLHDAGGVAGVSYDLLQVIGTLNLSNAVGFKINLWTLSSSSPEVSGPAIGFNQSLTQSWMILKTTGGILGFNPANFTIERSAGNGTAGFANAASGKFSLAVAGNNLVLNYTPLPAALTLNATGVTSNAATLNGSVNPGGAATTAWFEWGPRFSQSTTPVVMGAGLSAVPLGAALSGLTPGLNYPFRVVASNSVGLVTRGTALDFWSPVVTLLGASPITNGCSAFIDPGAIATASPTKIAAGRFHSLALQPDGHVVAWGFNNEGQATVPSNVSNVVAMAAGLRFSLALKADGTVTEWAEAFGPPLPATLTNVVAIAAGDDHGLALRADGTVIEWGAYIGKTPVPANATNITAIAAGAYHNLVVKADGTVIGWGNTNFGKASIPAIATNVIAVAAGYDHSLALKADGTVIGWGDSSSGQTTIPANATNIIALAVGYYHNLALRADGVVIGWGYNFYGETNVPANVTNVIGIAAGRYHSLALKADGTVIGWGNNDANQITIPALTNLALPIAVSGVVGATAGSYTLTYAATNSLGAVSTATRTVVVECSGAVPPVIKNLTRLANGSFQFAFTNVGGASFSVWATTNVALPFSNWTLLGPVTEISPGQFQFTHPDATNFPLRFYRVRSP